MPNRLTLQDAENNREAKRANALPDRPLGVRDLIGGHQNVNRGNRGNATARQG
jgi:hypothetical protein